MLFARERVVTAFPDRFILHYKTKKTNL
jgi:hypothetical protein